MIKRRSCRSDGPDCSRRVQYEPGPDEPLSVAAATALARYHDEAVTNSTTLLYDYVDPDAIDALFTDTARRRSATTIEIDAEDVRICIEADCVTVEPPD